MTAPNAGLLFLSEADVRPLLRPVDAIDAVEGVLRAQAADAAHFPLRTVLATEGGLLAAMSGAVGQSAGSTPSLGAKLVSVFNGNHALGLPSHQALIVLFDPATGRPQAVMDGRYITEVRTAAVSAVATRALAPRGARVAAILGTGVQAHAHALALRLVMPLDELRIWGRNRLHAQALSKELSAAELPARAVDSAEEACRGAGVICTVTASPTPVIPSGAVTARVHINAVGACTPHARELPADLMALAGIFVDSLDGALREAGDVVCAIADGALPAQPRLTLLSDVIAGRALGRATDDEITVFESLGIAIEDVACAALVYQRASERGVGTNVSL